MKIKTFNKGFIFNYKYAIQIVIFILIIVVQL